MPTPSSAFVTAEIATVSGIASVRSDLPPRLRIW
jgi:hypothetical protein